jgi:uncharacterized protein YbaP (TraB family)
VLLFATGQARAETPACAGKDIVQELAAERPDDVARIEAEAAKALNGKGLLWKVEKQGAAPSYLFGTMHMTDPRVIALTPDAQRAFDGAGTVVIETTDVIDKAATMAAFAKQPDLMMFTDGETLTSTLSAEDRAALEKGLADRGIPLETVIKMKPWMLISMVALPACETARQAAGMPVLDLKLAQDAKAAGKELKGLETLGDQLGAMASLPMEFHLRTLIDMLKVGDKAGDMLETMIVLYEREETALIMPLLTAYSAGLGMDNSGYAEFEQALIVKRNANMVRSAEPMLDTGNAFVAVGALHLPGPNGLVELLRKAGYTVTRVES